MTDNPASANSTRQKTNQGQRISLTIAFIAGLNTPSGQAEPNIRFTTDYYPVNGHDLPSLYASMQRNGPGGRFLAHTEWDIRWRYDWLESSGNCRLNGANVDIAISMLLPRPTTPEDFPPQVQQSWRRFFDALLRHEEHHRDYGIMAAMELDEQLAAMPPGPCPDFRNALSARAKTIIDKYERLEKDYDRRTDHGIKEGVVLK